MKLTEELDSWITHAYIESWIDKDTENRYKEVDNYLKYTRILFYTYNIHVYSFQSLLVFFRKIGERDS